MFFRFDKSKHLDSIIHFLPNLFRIYSEFELSPVFELDEHLVDCFVCGVFVQFIDFAQGKKYWIIVWATYAYFVVCYDYLCLVVFVVMKFAEYEFSINKNRNLSLLDLVFFES